METPESVDGRESGSTEYDKGYTLYGFSLAANQDQVFEVSKQGSIYLYLKLDLALGHAIINTIVYTEYENVIRFNPPAIKLNTD